MVFLVSILLSKPTIQTKNSFMLGSDWTQFSSQFLSTIHKVIPFSASASYQVISPTDGIHHQFSGNMSTQYIAEYDDYIYRYDPVHVRFFYNNPHIKMKALHEEKKNREYQLFLDKWDIEDTLEIFFRKDEIPTYCLSLVRSHRYGKFSTQEMSILESFYDLAEKCFQFKSQNTSITEQKEHLLEQLTRQERKIIELVCEGLTNQALADQLFCSVPTVKTHLQHIFKKMQVKNRHELMSLLLQHT